MWLFTSSLSLGRVAVSLNLLVAFSKELGLNSANTKRQHRPTDFNSQLGKFQFMNPSNI